MTDFGTSFSILWPALVAGVLVAVSHVPLGQQVLRRGIVFIDLAIAQVAALGVIAASAAGFELQGWMTQIAAVAAALLGAMLLTWTERRRPEVQEALIGVLFVLASTAQILLLANDPHGGEQLKDLLAGQILWVSTEQLVRAAILTAVFVVVWFRWRTRFGHTGFYVLFAVMVTMSVQLVGVYLVFTTLDRAGTRDLPARSEPAARARLRTRGGELPGRPRRVGRDRPAVERGDRLGDGGARDPAAPDGTGRGAGCAGEGLSCSGPSVQMESKTEAQ